MNIKNEQIAFNEWLTKRENGKGYPADLWEAWQARSALAQREPMIEDQALPSQLARRAQREPVADGEVQRYSLSKDDPNAVYPDKDGKWVKFVDWQRTEAARAAAVEDIKTWRNVAHERNIELATMQAGFDEQTTQIDVLQAQLTAELERGTKLAEAADKIGAWLSAALEETGPCKEFKEDARTLLEAITAYQSSKEN